MSKPKQILLSIWLLAFSALPLIVNGQAAAEDRQANPKFIESRNGDACKAEEKRVKDLRKAALKSMKKGRRQAKKSLRFVVPQMYMQYFCYDPADYFEIVLKGEKHVDKAMEKADSAAHFLNYLKGVIKMESRQSADALAYLERAVEQNPAPDERYHFYYARALHLNGKYEDALEHYTKALSKVQTDNFFSEALKAYIEQCNNALLLSDPDSEVEIQNLGTNINSFDMEYAPTVTADDSVLYFTVRGRGPKCQMPKRKAKKLDKIRRKKASSLFLESVFRAERTGNSIDNWDCPERLPKPINAKRHDNATSWVSENDDTLYVYQRKMFRMKKEQARGNLFMVTKSGTAADVTKKSTWGELVPIKGINSDEHEPHIAIAPDKSYAIFASDRPGGYGGYDLYIAYPEGNGQFGSPENMGETINTAGDERAPFIHSNGKTVYFSSNGHTSIGGHDIFKTRNYAGRWKEPQNLGAPMNSAADDIHFMRLPDKVNRGYFSSARAGGEGGYDIYGYAAPSEVLDFELPKIDSVIALQIYSEPGDPTFVDLYATAITPSSKYDSEEINDRYENMEVNRDGLTEVNDLNKEDLDFIGVVNFGFDSYYVTPYSRAKVTNKYLPDLNHPKIRNKTIYLIGHTDPYGSDAYNEQLSKNRVFAVYKYLLASGIDPKRIVVNYHGEKFLIIKDVTKAQHVINRRVEILVD